MTAQELENLDGKMKGSADGPRGNAVAIDYDFILNLGINS